MQVLRSLNQQEVLPYVTETQNAPRIKSCLSVQGADITAKIYNQYPLK
jgi:hypothetical protein